MWFESIASAWRTWPGSSAWVWLISAGLHLLVLLHWPTWHATAAPAPRWQVSWGPVTSTATLPNTPDRDAPTGQHDQPSTEKSAATQMATEMPTAAATMDRPIIGRPSTDDGPATTQIDPAFLSRGPVASPREVLLAQAPLAPSGLPASATPSLSAMGSYRAPSGARLRYDLQGIAKGFGYSAKAELLWQPDASQYDARLEVSHFLLGSRVQTSQGQLTAEGLLPRRFGDKVRSEQAAHFQRDKGLITYSANTPDAALLAGTQDRLSVFIQISGLLGAEPLRWGPGAVMSFNTTGARDTEVWSFQLSGIEQLKLPFGTLDAVRLVRQEQKQYDQRVELWMAPSLEHLPVRIRITQTSGDQVDLLLRSKELANASP